MSQTHNHYIQQNNNGRGSIPELRETASFPSIINRSIEALEDNQAIPNKQLSKSIKRVSKSQKRFKPRPVLEPIEPEPIIQVSRSTRNSNIFLDTFRISQPWRTLRGNNSERQRNNSERQRNYSSESSKIESTKDLNYNSKQLYSKLKDIANTGRENQKKNFTPKAKQMISEPDLAENTPTTILKEYGLTRKTVNHQKNFRSEHQLLKPISKGDSKAEIIPSPAVITIKKHNKKGLTPKNLIQIEDQQQGGPLKISFLRQTPTSAQNEFEATFSMPNSRESRIQRSNAPPEISEDSQPWNTGTNEIAPAKQTQTEPLSKPKPFHGPKIDATDSILSPVLLEPLQPRNTRVAPQKILLPLRGSHIKKMHYVSPERGFSTDTHKPPINRESPLIEFSNYAPNFYLKQPKLDQEPRPRYSYPNSHSYTNSLEGGIHSMTPGLRSESQSYSFNSESYFKSCFKNQKVVLRKIFKDGINF